VKRALAKKTFSSRGDRKRGGVGSPFYPTYGTEGRRKVTPLGKRKGEAGLGRRKLAVGRDSYSPLLRNEGEQKKRLYSLFRREGKVTGEDLGPPFSE